MNKSLPAFLLHYLKFIYFTLVQFLCTRNSNDDDEWVVPYKIYVQLTTTGIWVLGNFPLL